MLFTKQIKNEIEEVSSLLTLTEVYGEIAAARMKRIRENVLKSRNFLASIESIFQDCLKSYAQKLSELVQAGKLKEGGKITFLAHNGKSVAVLISANTPFYGDVIRKTFDKFMEDVRQNKDVEVTIIGRIGKNLFVSKAPDHPFTYFELPDFGTDRAKLSEAIKHLVQYEVIRVYYGKYLTVVTQKPTVVEISAGTPILGRVEQPKTKFIFEPDVEKILMFFETQIFASLFDQAIKESQLAKFASRILAMDKAADNVRKALENLKVKKLKLTHIIENKKQLNNLSSILSLR